MKSLLKPLLVWIGVIVIVSGYLRVELQTRFTPFSPTSFCRDQASLSYARVLSIQHAYKKAQVYCIYKDSRQNSIVLVTKNAITGWNGGNVRVVGNNLRFPLYF